MAKRKCNSCKAIEVDFEGDSALFKCCKCNALICLSCFCYPDSENEDEYYICPRCEKKRLVEELNALYKTFPHLSR